MFIEYNNVQLKKHDYRIKIIDFGILIGDINENSEKKDSSVEIIVFILLPELV
jgi:hypothetical protein